MKIEQYNKRVSIGDGIHYPWPHDIESVWAEFSVQANSAIINDVIRNIYVYVRYNGTLLQTIRGDRHWTPTILETRINNAFGGIQNEADLICDRIRINQEMTRRYRSGIVTSDIWH